MCFLIQYAAVIQKYRPTLTLEFFLCTVERGDFHPHRAVWGPSGQCLLGAVLSRARDPTGRLPLPRLSDHSLREPQLLLQRTRPRQVRPTSSHRWLGTYCGRWVHQCFEKFKTTYSVLVKVSTWQRFDGVEFCAQEGDQIPKPEVPIQTQRLACTQDHSSSNWTHNLLY